MSKRRLRIFAGPNGSGKSTIFEAVDKKIGCAYFVNADEIHKALSSKGKLSLTNYTILVDEDHLKVSFRDSSFFERSPNSKELLSAITVKNNILYISDPALADSYFCAFVADFLRVNMLNIVEEFCIETVLSDPRKLEYIRLAKSFGYRIYLYFVSTKDVEINIRRIQNRVILGGHSVPEEKVKKRYSKSLDNAFDVLRLCDRAYFFDNSEQNWVQIAEYNSGYLQPTQDSVPSWFYDYVISKIENQNKPE